ncbi:MAG: metal ABC transporter ATP-binding protein [Candidatus Moranbacteria bacterium]|jgi:zinc transport system ATP-binding protein|nr:metal ABC transporter ATP-binding protein [Candidatus Moranbacteria bacterium]
MDKLTNKLSGVDHTKNIIEIENVSFGYDNREDVLKNITLQIHKGDYIGFVGPNGSGKTTLIKVIIGLLKFREGSIKIFGEDMKNFKDWHKIGYVPQKMANFDKNFPVTVAEVVMMGRYSKRKFGQRLNLEDKKMTQEALEKVGMENYQERLIGSLSGGQMQRVFIARALVNEPEVIFLDEPTSGIDEKSQGSFYELLQKLNKDMGITLVMVSHDIGKLTQEVMHIVCVNRTLTCHTTPEEFIRESQSANIFGQDVKIITQHNHN